MRTAALAAAALAIALCASCSRAEPIEIPVPDSFDLEAASGVHDQGNGLWLLEGPLAASQVIDAMHSAGAVSMSASVLEMVPVEQGDPVVGRSIEVMSRFDGANLHASLTLGDQTGEFIAIDDDVWIRGNEVFAAAVGLPTQLLAEIEANSESFVCVSRYEALLDPLERIAEPAEFMRTTLNGLEIGTPLVSLDESDTQTLVLGTGGAPTGELEVALRGAPLPRHLFVSDESGTVQAEFTWDDADAISAPNGVDESCS